MISTELVQHQTKTGSDICVYIGNEKMIELDDRRWLGFLARLKSPPTTVNSSQSEPKCPPSIVAIRDRHYRNETWHLQQFCFCPLLHPSMCEAYYRWGVDWAESTTGYTFTPWHRHQIEGTNGFYCLIRKTERFTISNVESQVFTPRIILAQPGRWTGPLACKACVLPLD